MTTTRTLKIVIAAAALFLGVAVIAEHSNNAPSHTNGLIPWCPPFCSKGAK